MTFKDQSWEARKAVLGDPAEAQFEAQQTRGFVRLGLNRPPIQLSALHQHFRHLPDYLTSRGLVEVMGFGRDQKLRLKISKLESLKFWNMIQPVHLFVWDSHKKRSAELPISFVEACTEDAELRRFPEGLAYYEIDAAQLFEAVAA